MDSARLLFKATPGIAAWTLTTMEFDAAEHQSKTFWEVANPSRITVPAGITKIDLSIALESIALLSSGVAHFLHVRKNGTTNVIDKATSAGSRGIEFIGTGPLDCIAGDYYEIRVWSQANWTRKVLGSWVGIQAW